MMHLLLIIAAAAALWLAPGVAQACGCCDHQDHRAAAPATPATAKLGPGEARVEIPVSGMHCGHCAARVEAAVQELDGVKTADVQLHDGKVVVVFEKAKLAPAKIVEAIDALGFKAGPPVAG